jgi:hypothetical protein
MAEREVPLGDEEYEQIIAQLRIELARAQETIAQ